MSSSDHERENDVLIYQIARFHDCPELMRRIALRQYRLARASVDAVSTVVQAVVCAAHVLDLTPVLTYLARLGRKAIERGL